MKKKYKRFGKSTISVVLALLMIVSSMMLGSIATIEASAWAYTFDDDTVMYYNAGAVNWWQDGGNSTTHYVYIWFSGDSSYATWRPATKIDGTNIYYFTFPKDQTWNRMIIARCKTDMNTTQSFDNVYNKTGDITLAENKNYVSSFSQNSTNVTWSTYQPTPTITMTAPTSQTVTTGASVTCSSTNTVDSTFSTGTTAYRVYNSEGTSEVGSRAASVSGSTITFNTVGTYQVKAALTYTANGFSSISNTVYSDAATITVEDPSGPVTGISVAAKYGTDGSTFGTLTTEPSVTITGDNSATANLSGGTVSITGSGTVRAAESFQISGTTYAFTKWTSSGSGTFEDDSDNETTFYARTANEVVTANYTKCYNVNVTQTSGGRISVDSNLVQAGGSFTVTAVPNDLYEAGTLTVTGGTLSTASFTNNVCTYSPMPASDVTISASFTTNYRRIYVYNRFNWGNLHLHYWGGSSESTWPGELMTKDKEYSGLYYLDIPNDTTTVIFNSGTDSNGKNFAQSREITIDSTESNCVLVPDNEEIYTSGQWSNLEDYTTVTSIYDNRNYYKIYFKLSDKLESTGKDLYVFSGSSDELKEHRIGYFRKQLTRVYDYVDPETGAKNLYYFIAWQGTSAEKNAYTGAYEKSDLSANTTEGDKNIISKYHWYLYDNITASGYIRVGATYNDTGFWGAGSSTTAGTTNSFTKRIGMSSGKNGVVFVPNNQYVGEKSNSSGKASIQRVGIMESSLSDISYNVSKSNKTTATVYAKSGTIRNSYDKYSRMADVQNLVYNDDGTTITSSTGWSHSTNGGSYRERVAAVEKGRTFTVSVKIKDDFKYKYYVKAWCINGDTYNIIDQDEAIKHKGTGEYTCEYTIGDNEDGPIEITPIYFAFVNNKDANDYITFYVEDFEDVKDAWGGTLACYAYYRTGSNGTTDDTLEPTAENDAQKSALGGYPGQPMVYENGSFYMQIPRTRTVNGTAETVKGITLNNYVWDFVHSQNIKGLWSDSDRQNANCQTYDYDDFVALATVTNDIIFNFKNRTTNNPGDTSTAQSNATKGNLPSTSKQTLSSYTNGWNVLTDYYDYPVDLFSNRLTNASYDTEEEIAAANATVGSDSNMIYVVSNGYEIYNDYIGQYATKWFVYDYQGNFLGALPPSVFYTATPNGTFSSDSLMNFGVASGFKDNTVTPNDGTHTTYAAVAEYLWNQCKGKPVVITYETALRSVGAPGSTSNPGLRNDGRWYYSIANSKIWANIKIEYEDDNGDYVEDTLIDGTTDGQGTVTQAHACFTNDPSEGTIDSTKTSMTNVTQTKKNYFRFVADPSSTVTQTVGSVTTTTTYVFKGWYLTTGGGVYNPINVGDDLSNPEGKRLMNSNATFVARYEKVVSATLAAQDTSSPRYLTVNHNLLANGPTPAIGTKPTVHNGTGTPLVTVEILKQTTSGGTTTTTVLKSYKNAPGTNFVKIDPKYLTNDNYKVRVSLTTNTDSETSFVSTYQYDSSYTQAVANQNSCTSVTNSSKTVVYEYTVSDLFGYDGTSTTSNLKTLNYYTDLSTNYIKVVFKYFDRNITANEATDINQTATEVPVYGSTKSADGTSFSLENAIVDAFGNGNVSSSFNNVTDQYVFWRSQTKATDATDGFGALTDFHDADKRKYSVTSPSNLDYHRDCYGRALSNPTDADKWVTYTTLSGDTAVVTNATTANGSDYANIDYITVWCYNYPKTYNVHLYMPNPEEEYVTTGENINVENATSNSTVWDIDADGVIVVKDEGGSPFAKSISGYYNMRIGGAETGGTAEQNAAIDGASDYLTAYGLLNAVTEAYTPPMNQIPVKVDVKDSEGIITGQEIKTYQFKGWYIDNNGTKVLLSTDRYYKNRITRDLDLFAGYEPTTSTASTLPGVAVTNGGKDETITYYNKGSEEDPEWTTTVIAEADQANVTISGVDYYYDEKGIKRVRFNTQMNVYDSKDSNENIKKAAVLYLQLPVTDDMGNQITWTQSDLDALHLTDYESNVEGAVGPQIKTFIDAMSTELTAGSSYYAKSSSSAITITRDGTTYNAKLIAYNYIVKWSTTEAGYDANDCAVLTTKNRIEYVLPMRADYYEGVDAGSEHIPGSNSAVITYAAIYYDDSTDEIDAQWIESDNYVAYTHDLMPG